jgi:hypothetical protein
MNGDRWISAVEWGVIVVIIAIDFAFAQATGIGVRRALDYTKTFAIILAAWPALALLIRATGIAKGGDFIAEMVAKALIFISVATVLEYYLATSPAPLRDQWLINADRALGFDWPAVFAWFQEHAGLRHVLAVAYSNLALETGIVALTTALFFPARARRFTTALIVSSLLTIPMLWLLPVAGPFVTFDHLDLPQADYTQHYLAMRAHAFAAIPLDDPRGIVSFPSYHAAAAVLLTYLVRGIRGLFPAACLFNGAMLIGTPVLGGHYFVDVLAGLAVAAATIAVIERVAPERAAPSLPLFRRRAPVEAESA